MYSINLNEGISFVFVKKKKIKNENLLHLWLLETSLRFWLGERFDGREI